MLNPNDQRFLFWPNFSTKKVDSVVATQIFLEFSPLFGEDEPILKTSCK